MVLCLAGREPTFEPPVHSAPLLEGNLFPSCYCIDVFFSLCKSSTKLLLVRVSIDCMKCEFCRLGLGEADDSRQDLGF